MNRLAGSMVYAAGPIDRCPDGGKQWRAALAPELRRRGIVMLDPLKKPTDVGLEDDDHRGERASWKASGDYERFAAVMRKIRAVDLRLVDKADFLIVKMDLDVFMCGTMEELFLANRQHKVVLVWCPQGIGRIPDWMYGVLPHEFFFDTIDGVLAYIDHVATAPDIDTLNRWLFLNHNDLYHDDVIGMIRSA